MTDAVPVAVPPTMVTPPVPLMISKIGRSGPEVVWCWGQGCKYPNARIRFNLSRTAPVRLVLQAKAQGRWKQVFVTTIKGHRGSNVRRLAGRWHGGLVPAREVRILVQLNATGHWKTRTTLYFSVKHQHK